MKFLDETAKHCYIEIEHKTSYQETRDDVGVYQPPSFKTWYDITSQITLIHRYDGENNLIDTITPKIDEKTGRLYQVDIGHKTPEKARQAVVSIFENGEPKIVGLTIDRGNQRQENE